jgi:hypothetical protein
VKDDRRYIRVYHSAIDDPKFVGIWDNDARLALWVRLLVAADLAWPQSAALPRSTKVSALTALVDCGLVDMVGKDQYRIHGMDSERTARHDRAVLANRVRWDAPSHPDRSPTGSPSGNANGSPAGNPKVIPNRTEHNRRYSVDTGVPAPARPNTVDRSPLLRQIREVYKAKDEGST